MPWRPPSRHLHRHDSSAPWPAAHRAPHRSPPSRLSATASRACPRRVDARDEPVDLVDPRRWASLARSSAYCQASRAAAPPNAPSRSENSDHGRRHGTYFAERGQPQRMSIPGPDTRSPQSIGPAATSLRGAPGEAFIDSSSDSRERRTSRVAWRATTSRASPTSLSIWSRILAPRWRCRRTGRRRPGPSPAAAPR